MKQLYRRVGNLYYGRPLVALRQLKSKWIYPLWCPNFKKKILAPSLLTGRHHKGQSLSKQIQI